MNARETACYLRHSNIRPRKLITELWHRVKQEACTTAKICLHKWRRMCLKYLKRVGDCSLKRRNVILNGNNLIKVTEMPWAGWLSRCSDCLRARRSGEQIPVWARFFAPVQTGPEANPASCTMSTESFPGVKCGGGVTLTPHPLLVPRPKIE
jgi:hypothetical protein